MLEYFKWYLECLNTSSNSLQCVYILTDNLDYLNILTDI